MAELTRQLSDDGSLSSSSSSSPLPSSSISSLEAADAMNANTYWSVLTYLDKLDQDDSLYREESSRIEANRELRALRPSQITRTVSARLRQDWAMITQNREEEYTAAEVCLRQDFAANKVRWYGHFGKDLWCFLRNNNPLLAMFCSHRLHPISRSERWVAFGMQFLIVLFVSCAITEASCCVAIGVTSCAGTTSGLVKAETAPGPAALRQLGGGGKVLAAPGAAGAKLGTFADLQASGTGSVHKHPSDELCCTCAWAGIIWTLQKLGSGLGGTLYTIVVNCIFTITIFQSFMCMCVQHHGPRNRECGECVGKGVVILIALGLTIHTPSLVTYINSGNRVRHVMWAFVSGKVMSIAFVTVINIIGFSAMWRQQREDPESGEESRFHVTAEEYNEYCRSAG